MIARLGEAGVLVSPGQIYHVAEMGWAGVSFPSRNNGSERNYKGNKEFFLFLSARRQSDQA